MSRLPTSPYPPVGPGASNSQQQQQQRHLQPASAIQQGSLRPPSSSITASLGPAGSMPSGLGGGPVPSVVSGSTHIGSSSLAGHLELTRQLAGSFDGELAKLALLAEAFYDALDRSVDSAGEDDPKARTEALKLVQLQLAHVGSLARHGLGAVPVPFPPQVATAAVDGIGPSDQSTTPAASGASPPTLEGLTAGWAAELPALFSQRQAFREAVAVAEGVLKRAG